MRSPRQPASCKAASIRQQLHRASCGLSLAAVSQLQVEWWIRAQHTQLGRLYVVSTKINIADGSTGSAGQFELQRVRQHAMGRGHYTSCKQWQSIRLDRYLDVDP